MKTILVPFVVLLAGVSQAKGLAVGRGAMSPMEARLERASGNKDAESTRIQNTQRKAAKVKSAVPNATTAASGSKTTYKTVTKPCCNAKQTVTASGGATVGVGATKAAAAAAAQSPKASGKATW